MVDGSLVDKTHEDFDEKDKAMISENVQAKIYLICFLDMSIYNSIETSI